MCGNKTRLLFVSLLGTLFMVSGCSFTDKAPDQSISVPRGWYVSLNNSNITLVKAAEHKESYQLLFDRSPEKEGDLYYIQIAESIYPERQLIKNALPEKESLSDLKVWYFERLWWYEKYKGFQIPFCLTGDTVSYYLNQYITIKEEIKKRLKIDNWKGGNQNRIQFRYLARVERRGQPISSETDQEGKTTNMAVKVIMKMKWRYFCGQSCGWGFEKERTVSFSGPRNVNRITGDGIVKVWTSEQHDPQYSPDQWITF